MTACLAAIGILCGGCTSHHATTATLTDTPTTASTNSSTPATSPTATSPPAPLGSTPPPDTNVSAIIAGRLQRLSSQLPPGMELLGTSNPAPPGTLDVQPVHDLDPATLHPATVAATGGLKRAIAALREPFPVAVRRLLVSSDTPQPGTPITIAAADLPRTTPHAMLLILQGPGYNANQLVQTANGATAAVIELPPHMAKGTWYILAEDLSDITANSNHTDTGTVLIEVSSFPIN